VNGPYCTSDQGHDWHRVQLNATDDVTICRHCQQWQQVHADVRKAPK
jgi:hypothetical protein